MDEAQKSAFLKKQTKLFLLKLNLKANVLYMGYC